MITIHPYHPMLIPVFIISMLPSVEYGFASPTHTNETSQMETVITTGTTEIPLQAVYTGVPIRENIVWWNNTTSQEDLLNFDTSCGCTKPEIKVPVSLKPGEKLSFPVVMQTVGREGVFSEKINAFTQGNKPLWGLVVNGKAMPRFSITNPVIKRKYSTDKNGLIVPLIMRSHTKGNLAFSISIEKPFDKFVSIHKPQYISPDRLTTAILNIKIPLSKQRSYIQGEVIYGHLEQHPFTITVIGLSQHES